MTLLARQDVTTSDGSTPEGGVYITVKLNGAVASIFDSNGNAQANPFQSANDGSFSYYVTTAGTYTEEYRFNLGDTPRTVETVSLSAIGAAPGYASRSAIADLTPISGQAATLTESGREGTFVFDTANHSTHVTNDPQQGIYVAPSSDTTGASGAWVRHPGIDTWKKIEWFGGGTSKADTVNKTAWDALCTLCAPCTVQLSPGTYSITQMVFPGTTGTGSKAVNVRGAGRGSTNILITGDGGGAPSLGTNGGVIVPEQKVTIAELTIQYNNPSLQCLLNLSNATVPSGRITLYNVDLAPVGLTASQVQATAVAFGNHTEFQWIGGQIGAAPNFKQNCVILTGGLLNGCYFQGVWFRPHAVDLANGVYWDSLPQFDMNGRSTQGLLFSNCGFEQGPNGIACTGQGEVAFQTCYFGDGSNSKNATGWHASQAVSQGDFIFPSASITATSDGSTAVLTSVSATTALYPNMRVHCVGMGAAGADLAARILSISGTTVTLDTNTATAVVGAKVYYGAYAGHGYRCITAGTTGTSQPTWPTTAGGTVVDGTATWREYGSCSWIEGVYNGVGGKDCITLNNCVVGNLIVGIHCERSAGQFAHVLNVTNCRLNINDHAAIIDGTISNFSGNEFYLYSNLGVELRGVGGASRGHVWGGNFNLNVTNGADFVVSTNTSNVGGVHIGSTILTGIGKGQFSSHYTDSSAGPTLSVPGMVLATGTTNGGIGYGTGAGSSVTQTTSRTTGVTINRPCGTINLLPATAGSTSWQTFTVTNSCVAATDVIRVNQKSGTDKYMIHVTKVGSGSFDITYATTGGTTSEQPAFSFAVIKAVAS